MKKLLLFLYAIVIGNASLAQGYSQFKKSDTISIASKFFQSERKVIITKSQRIKIEAKENNCIIYTDADDKNINGTLLQVADNLCLNKEIPQSYFVGIIQQDRDNELLEKDKLLRFLKEELVPLLKKNYNIAERVTIVGHSFGAYFATYAFLKENAIFNSCIAISPAYWPNNIDVLALMEEKSITNSIRGNFYMAIGDKRWDEISLRKYVVKAQGILKSSQNIRFDFSDLKGFSHNATPTVGYGLGLSFIYDEWEWGNILDEQERRLKSFPTFWGHLEVKADALYHLGRPSEAKTVYNEALKDIPKDQDLSDKEKSEIAGRLNNKIKNCI